MRVQQWAVETLRFRATSEYETPYRFDRPPGLHCVFEPDRGQALELEGYWDGENDWCVRFCLPTTGEWRWHTRSQDSGLDGQSGEIICEPATNDQININANFRGHLRVAKSGRHFVYADDTPFFLLADTNWAMPSRRCAMQERQDGPFDIWLQNRLEKGFTAVLTTLFDIDQSNSGGHPFPNNTKWPGNESYEPLNPGYFAQVDAKMQALWDAGLIIACHPTWIGRQYGFEPEDAAWIWRYLLARYGAYNLIWSVSGEYQFGYADCAPWRPWTREDYDTLGNVCANANPYHHPLSIHPRGVMQTQTGELTNIHTASSGLDFHQSGWLDHNWIQSGQNAHVLRHIPLFLEMDYKRKPARPAWLAEGFYENHRPTGASARMIRWQAWTAFLGGGCGYGYGSGGVWQFHDPEDHSTYRKGRANQPNWDGLGWREGLDRTGAAQLAHLKTLMAEIPWYELAPAQGRLLVRGFEPELEDSSTPRCAATPDNIVVVYVPYGNSAKHIGIKGLPRRFKARWYNPRSGETTAMDDGDCKADGNGFWESPGVPNKSDWVICIKPNDITTG